MSVRSAVTVLVWLVLSLLPALPLSEVGAVDGGDLIKLLVEWPLALVACYAIRELKPVARDYLNQQLVLLQQLIAGQQVLVDTVKPITDRLDVVDSKLTVLVQARSDVGTNLVAAPGL